jgi:TolA-binding protein
MIEAVLAICLSSVAAAPGEPHAHGPSIALAGSFAEFEKKVRVLRKRQDEANAALEKVRQQEKPSEQDVQKMRESQSKVTEAANDVFEYMSQSKFTDQDREEMQKIMDRILAETPTSDGKKTARAADPASGAGLRCA